MPDVTPNSPGEFSPFNSEFEHVRAHRALERAIEQSIPGSQATSSTAAPLVGIYRTAAPIAVSVPAITMLGVSTVTNVFTFSIAGQVAVSACVGDAVTIIPISTLPTNVELGAAHVTDTNSITVGVFGRGAASLSATFTCHVFFSDLT